MASVFPLCLVAGVALTPGPSPYGRGGNFGFDVGCGWLGMGCGMDFRSFGFAQDDMVWWGALTPGPPSCSKRITFHHTFKLTKPESKPKPKKVSKPKPKKPQARKPRTPTHTPEERKDLRRKYDKLRNQTVERKEFHRLQAKKVRDERKAAGLCKTCPNPAIPGQARCEACRDKQNQSRNRGTEGKPRRPKLTPEERIEARREYERVRAQKPERKEAARLRAQKRWQERKAARLARPG